MSDRRTSAWMGGVIAGVCALGVAGFATAQDNPDEPEAPPESTPASNEQSEGSREASSRIAEEMSRESFATPAFRADGFGEDGASGIPAAHATLLPEGSFLADRRGILVPVGDRDWGFVFDVDAKGEAERPMLLQPSLRLAEMVRLRASRDRTATFVVSGRVMIYRGVNVLMPEASRLLPTDVVSARAEVEAEKTVVANRVLAPENGEPSIDDLLARIDAARGTQDSGIEGSELDDAARQARGDLVAEGASVVSMRGRVTQNPSGRLVFVREGDAGPLNPRAGELVLLRCRNLEALEQLWQRHGDRFVVTVSGPVTVFEGSNYLLPLMYVVESRKGGDITSAQ